MKKLYIRALYGVEQKVFNVGDGGKVKTHWNPITNREYAYGSSANVKHNIKELFSEIANIAPPKTEFNKIAKIDNGKISINEDGEGEQSGVSTIIDVENPICKIFGAWTSEVPNGEKYAKASLKSNIMISDMMPTHSLLQNLSKEERGVFCGGVNSSIVLSLAEPKKKKTFLKTPEEAAEFAECSIEEAKKAFASVRTLNCYDDKRTSTGLYNVDFAIELDVFGKIKISDMACELQDNKINELISKGWRVMEINGEKYISPSKDDLIKIWEYLINAIFDWDFTSNNSLHGSVKEVLRYSISFNAQKLNQCTTATMYCEDGKLKAKLALRNSKEVYNFNTTNLEKWHVCDGSDGNEPIKTNIDADYDAKELLIQIGKDNIL